VCPGHEFQVVVDLCGAEGSARVRAKGMVSPGRNSADSETNWMKQIVGSL